MTRLLLPTFKGFTHLWPQKLKQQQQIPSSRPLRVWWREIQPLAVAEVIHREGIAVGNGGIKRKARRNTEAARGGDKRRELASG